MPLAQNNQRCIGWVWVFERTDDCTWVVGHTIEDRLEMIFDDVRLGGRDESTGTRGVNGGLVSVSGALCPSAAHYGEGPSLKKSSSARLGAPRPSVYYSVAHRCLAMHHAGLVTTLVSSSC